MERNIAAGLSPREAAHTSMDEVGSALIAIALVLCAVFVPAAFIMGISGQFYRQFALTIAISTVISAFASLTLAPALSAALLKPHDAPKDRVTRAIDAVFGRFFAGFNRFFGRASHRYEGGVQTVLRRKTLSLGVYAILGIAALFMFKAVPAGFVPQQDKAYLIGFAQLPDAASLDRHLPTATADAVVETNAQSRINGLRAAVSILALLSLVALLFTRGIPRMQPGAQPSPVPPDAMPEPGLEPGRT